MKDDRTVIYKITGPKGKVYIGSAINYGKRYNQHTSALNNDRHSSVKLQRAWNKYGKEAFSFLVVEVVESHLMIEREQFYIDLFDCARKGYNICPVAGNTLGRMHSHETRKKISIKATGRKASEETKRKMSEKLRLRKGEKRSAETCNRISKSKKGKRLSEEAKKNISRGLVGRVFSEEHKKNHAEAMRRPRIISDETRIKMSESAKKRCMGAKRSPDGTFKAKD